MSAYLLLETREPLGLMTGIHSVEVETKNKILTLILLQLDLFKAAYVPRLRIKPFVVRFSRVKVAVGSAFTRSSRSDRAGASTRFFFFFFLRVVAS